MTRYRYDRDLDAIVAIGDNYFKEKAAAPGIISDIEPYRAAASDIACEGKRPMIGGRRQHREFLRRNGYAEVGDENVAPRREELSQSDRVADIKRALGD